MSKIDCKIPSIVRGLNLHEQFDIVALPSDSVIGSYKVSWLVITNVLGDVVSIVSKKKFCSTVDVPWTFYFYCTCKRKSAMVFIINFKVCLSHIFGQLLLDVFVQIHY